MAYDPEARETSNTAMIIGIVVLVLLVGGALAYFATRPVEVVDTPVIVEEDIPPVNNTVVIEREVPVPVEDNSPDTVIVPPPIRSTTNSVTTIERERIIERPANNNTQPNNAQPAQPAQPRVDTDVTVNVPSQPSTANNGAVQRAPDAATGNAASPDGY